MLQIPEHKSQELFGLLFRMCAYRYLCFTLEAGADLTRMYIHTEYGTERRKKNEKDCIIPISYCYRYNNTLPAATCLPSKD
jgi:hypothetical protein